MAPRKAKAPVAEELNQNRNVDGAKRAVLDKAVGDILKRYGDGSIVRLGEAQHMQTESYPTGSLSLDIALCAAFHVARHRDLRT
jgi:recombination protein RecA